MKKFVSISILFIFIFVGVPNPNIASGGITCTKVEITDDNGKKSIVYLAKIDVDGSQGEAFTLTKEKPLKGINDIPKKSIKRIEIISKNLKEIRIIDKPLSVFTKERRHVSARYGGEVVDYAYENLFYPVEIIYKTGESEKLYWLGAYNYFGGVGVSLGGYVELPQTHRSKETDKLRCYQFPHEDTETLIYIPISTIKSIIFLGELKTLPHW